MDFISLVKEARSCRRFLEADRLGLDAIYWLIDCARIAPCARNAQVLRFMAGESKAACEAIFTQTRWAGALKWDGPIAGERPTAYIAILTPEKCGKLVHMDVGIAAQTIQLAAQSKGIGCCMHASFSPKECAEIFEVPEGLEIALILGLGIEKERRVLADMPQDGSFGYWRDDDGVHFVPKRPLSEVLLRTF